MCRRYVHTLAVDSAFLPPTVSLIRQLLCQFLQANGETATKAKLRNEVVFGAEVCVQIDFPIPGLPPGCYINLGLKGNMKKSIVGCHAMRFELSLGITFGIGFLGKDSALSVTFTGHVELEQFPRRVDGVKLEGKEAPACQGDGVKQAFTRWDVLKTFVKVLFYRARGGRGPSV